MRSPSSRNNRAKILQNFGKSGTPRAQKLHALGQRSLRILHNVAESSSSQHCIQIQKKESVQRRNHANFAPNSREKTCKIFEKFRRATRTKIASNLPALLRKPQEFTEAIFLSRYAFQYKMTRESSVEITQNLRKKSGEFFAKFPENPARHAQKKKRAPS